MGLLAMAISLVRFTPAAAVPSFAQQTGQPCQACHVGAFGPQLKPYGRDFKLYGYQSSDNKSRELAIAFMVQTSVTHTNADQTPPPAPHFSDNDNFAVDQVSMFYAGRAPMGFGVFAQATYSGVDRAFNLDNVDVRKVKEVTLFGRDAVVGFDFNNNPTVQDVWNTTPAWGFPYNGSSLAPTPQASALIDGGLGGLVAGAGLYGVWDDTIYLEATAYAPLNRVVAGRLGEGTTSSSDRYSGLLPYWRVALLHDFGSTQSAELGAYGVRAERFPGGDVSQGTDTLTDWAIDGTYQYIGSSRHVISAHATYIHEDQDLKASAILAGTRPRNTLTTARADVSYSYADTWTPSAQVFSTTGTFDPALYNPGLRTNGYVMELAWSPFGKPDSPISWANARFALQYVGYTEFNGDRRHAGDNDTLYLNTWIALAPLGWRVNR
jgi:hypothetical protein